jgi:uncharacterized damage-inducible protein DinB
MKSLLNKLSLYNDWANQQLFRQFEQLEDKIPVTSMHLFCHIINTQAVWLSRIQGQLSALRPWDDHTLEVCKEMHQQANEILKDYTTTARNLEQVITYVNTKGQQFENSIYDILIHVFNHGTYHRAQIAQDMRRNGIEPINTDYITFVR